MQTYFAYPPTRLRPNKIDLPRHRFEVLRIHTPTMKTIWATNTLGVGVMAPVVDVHTVGQ